MNARVERALGFVVLGVIVLVGLGLIFAGEPGRKGVDDAIGSTQETGRRALWLELSELGFDPIQWDDSPNHLRGHDLLWLSSVPTTWMPGEDPGGKGLKRIGLHALDHYREFVERGGTLMLHAGDGATHFLADELGFEACRSVKIDGDVNAANAGACKVRTGGDEDLDVGLDGDVFAPLDPNSTARVVWSATCSGTTHPFVVEVPEGAGSVVLLAQDSFVRNASIGERDNAVAAVRLVEQVLRDGRLLLDEYETGTWAPPSVLGLLTSPRFVLASLHLFACLALFVWMNAYARAFPRDREPLELFSSLARARALGGVLARAHRYPALGKLLRRGTFARLSRRIPGYRFVPQVPSVQGATAGAAPVDRSVPRDGLATLDSLRAVTSAEVAALAGSAGMRDRVQELEAAFVTRPVLSRHDLEALDADFGRIRREIEDHLGSRSLLSEADSAQRELSTSAVGATKGTE